MCYNDINEEIEYDRCKKKTNKEKRKKQSQEAKYINVNTAKSIYAKSKRKEVQ